MAKAKKAVKKSAAKEALGSPALPSRVVLFPAKPVLSKKPVKRAASKIKKTRAQADQPAVVAAAPVKELAVKPAVAPKPAEKKINAVPKGLVNSVCFWAGSVLSDSNAFLRMKKAN